jgi:hypothetical protein
MIALAAQRPVEPTWTTLSPPDVGFSIQGPGTAVPSPTKPTTYLIKLGDGSFIVQVEGLDPRTRQALAAGDKKLLATHMETLRDTTIENMLATRRTTSSADFNGHPSLFYTFAGAIGSQQFEGTHRMVLANDRLYLVAVIGAAGKVNKADIDRFHGSFRITSAPPPALTTAQAAAGTAAGYRRISYTDALCSKLPPVAVQFEVPADFIARAPTPAIQSGCVLGTKDDVDRVIADPAEGFTKLSGGVFYLRVSTEVINDPRTGVFDGMDGTGEAGLRRQLVAAGAKLVTFNTATLGGLPTLQVVGTIGGDRAYMLYIGNTRYNSNAILVSYHSARRSAADDDRMWAHFIAGIRPD